MKIDFSKKDEQIVDPKTGWLFTALTVAFAIFRCVPSINAAPHGFTGMSTWALVGLMCGLIAIVVAVRVRNLPMGVIAFLAAAAPSIAHAAGLI